MPHIVSSILNRIPRRHLQRLAPLVRPLVMAARFGRARTCPVCGGRYRKFLPFGYIDVRPDALCPSCFSLERHRLMWLFLQRETDFFTAKPRLLHIAPESCFIRRFERLLGDRYVTGDLESPLAKVKMDIRRMPFADESFDAVFCNHVLEHIDDDRLAMREIHRVLCPGGWGIVMVPVNLARETTCEDPSITDEAGRLAAFGQRDHVREYGRDYPQRLAEAGFEVDAIDYIRTLPEAEIVRYGLRPEVIYRVRKP